MEAESTDAVVAWCDNLLGFYLKHITQVERDEAHKLLAAQPALFPASNSWVTIRSGLYKGDIGLLVEPREDFDNMTVLTVPRLIESRKRERGSDRAPAARLPRARAVRIFGVANVFGTDPFRVTVSDTMRRSLARQLEWFTEEGFQILQLRPKALRRALPHITAIKVFADSAYSGLLADRRRIPDTSSAPPINDWAILEYLGVEVDSLSTSVQLRTRDRVMVLSGSLAGSFGELVEPPGSTIARIRLLDDPHHATEGLPIIEVETASFVRWYQPGDSIMVKHGIYAGSPGFVLYQSESRVVVCDPGARNTGIANNEVRV